MDDLDDLDNPTGEDDLAWRETYVVLFKSDAHPTLTQVEAVIGNSGRKLVMERLMADDDGLFRSVLVQAPEDHAVLDVRYEEGEAITERAMQLAQKLRKDLDGDQLARLLRADAWLEIMHFERLAAVDPWADSDPDDDPMGPEGLDPATLITVVDALATLTDGLPIDPTAGEVLL